MGENYRIGENYCNNCIKTGHSYVQCKIPITSFGVIAFRYSQKTLQYLMICRKDTLGYIDFMRGKYQLHNKFYILNMLKQMTDTEKNDLKTQDFDTLWKRIWGDHALSSQYKIEENVSREKFNTLNFGVLVKNDFYTLSSLIVESFKFDNWIEPEWGFPKGRRNFQENDYDCALREFTEETGYDSRKLKHINNCLHFEEIFTGSNYKSYKHIYYLMYMDDCVGESTHQDNEVSRVEWKTIDECLLDIRYYNIEKKRLITNINNALTNYNLLSSI
jgi:8-oxo-dGTP pyrophosphatase MutT (NUDIX family)